MEETPFLILILLVAIVMALGIPLVAILADARKKREIYALHHKERLAAIERGMEPPPLPAELFNGGARTKGAGAYLLRGLIWLAIGLGILVSIRPLVGAEESLLGLIPTGIGFAYLIYCFAEARRAPSDPQKAVTSGRGSV
jgi:hypothetical protein